MPTAFVTGAGRGIGAAVAQRLAKGGFDLVLHTHTTSLDQTADAVRAAGRGVTEIMADLSDRDEAWACAEQAATSAGTVDAFVANAGIYDRRPLADMTGDAWHRTMAVNLEAPALMVQAMQERLAETARIVLIGSIAAQRGSGHGAHYAASKAGLHGLARSLARELAPRTVNVVAPGYIDTDMIGDDTPARRAQRDAEVPLGVGRPDDVAHAVAWLCGPGAGYTTGQILSVNGALR